MNTSLKFKHIGTNALKILSHIIFNQNFLRYVKYLDDNPLDSAKPDIEDMLTETGDLVLSPFDNRVLTESKIKMFYYPLRGNMKNKSVSPDVYEFDIVCPLQYWIINRTGVGLGDSRPFLMAYEIAKQIDNKNVAGIGTVEITDWRVGKVNDNYAVLSLFIEVNNANVTIGSD